MQLESLVNISVKSHATKRRVRLAERFRIPARAVRRTKHISCCRRGWLVVLQSSFVGITSAISQV